MTLMTQLSDLGLRRTKTRLALLHILENQAKPLSVSQLLTYLGRKEVIINKTTLYRELETLIHHQLVTQIPIGRRAQYYELANLPHHHHLVCTQCERIEEITIKHQLKQLEVMLARKTKYKIQRHSLEFFGLCHLCQN